MVSAHQQPVKPPSVNALVKAISEEALLRPYGDPEPVVMLIPRPQFFSRLLVFLSITLIIILVVLMVLMTQHVNILLGHLHTEQDLRNNPIVPPLPTDAALLDEMTFALSLSHRPADAMRLYCARAKALLEAGLAKDAIACYQEAKLKLDNDLPAAAYVELSRAYMRTGNFTEALAILRTLDFALLSKDDVAAANDVLSRVLLAQQVHVRRRMQ